MRDATGTCLAWAISKGSEETSSSNTTSEPSLEGPTSTSRGDNNPLTDDVLIVVFQNVPVRPSIQRPPGEPSLYVFSNKQCQLINKPRITKRKMRMILLCDNSWITEKRVCVSQGCSTKTEIWEFFFISYSKKKLSLKKNRFLIKIKIYIYYASMKKRFVGSCREVSRLMLMYLVWFHESRWIKRLFVFCERNG